MRYEVTIVLHTEDSREELADKLLAVLPTNAGMSIKAITEEEATVA